MKEKHEGITFEGQPLETYISETENQEIDKVRRREIGERGRGAFYSYPTGKFSGNTSGGKSERRDFAKVEHSPEIIAHLNFLHLKGGIDAVHEFLNRPVAPQGSIEAALKDAEEKVATFGKEAQRLAAECHRWMEVRDRLLQARDILTGKVSVSSEPRALENGNGNASNRTRRARRDWTSIAKDILKNGQTMTKKEFWERLKVEAGDGLAKNAVYTAAYTLKSKGVIEEVDGLVALKGEPQ